MILNFYTIFHSFHSVVYCSFQLLGLFDCSFLNPLNCVVNSLTFLPFFCSNLNMSDFKFSQKHSFSCKPVFWLVAYLLVQFYGFLGGSDSKESAYNVWYPDSIHGLEGSPGEGNGNPLCSCHEQRCLGSYSLWSCKELDMTEQLTLFTLSINFMI